MDIKSDVEVDQYNLEAEVRQELASGLTPEEALEEWDIL